MQNVSMTTQVFKSKYFSIIYALLFKHVQSELQGELLSCETQDPVKYALDSKVPSFGA